MAFPETIIPSTETNYYCMTFDLPSDQDYHVIATEPIMDNLEVLHHILVYACEDGKGYKVICTPFSLLPSDNNAACRDWSMNIIMWKST